MLRADPHDGTRLVYADWLISQGDPRGTLIILDHADRTGVLAGSAITALLWLSAEHGFPHLPDPDAHMLAWESVEVGIVGRDEYLAHHDGHRYWLRHHQDGLLAYKVDDRPMLGMRTVTGRLSDEATNVVLSIASRAIRGNVPFETLELPTTAAAMRAHPDYRLGPFPRYVSHEIADELGRPQWSLAARDYYRWYSLWERLLGPA
jgi:uncharacterized protein (TIGR02996 family)